MEKLDTDRVKILAGLGPWKPLTIYEAKDHQAEEFEHIMAEIKRLAEEALHIVRQSDDGNVERAKAYWYAHIVGAVDREEYPNASMVTMSDTLSEILDETDEEREKRRRG